MKQNLATKEETKRRMLSMFDNIAMKIAEQQVSLTKLKYTQSELDFFL